MKLTIKRSVIAEPSRVETEITLEEENPIYKVSPAPTVQELDSDSFPSHLYYKPIETDLSFPLVELLLKTVLSEEKE